MGIIPFVSQNCLLLPFLVQSQHTECVRKAKELPEHGCEIHPKAQIFQGTNTKACNNVPKTLATQKYESISFSKIYDQPNKPIKNLNQ